MPRKSMRSRSGVDEEVLSGGVQVLGKCRQCQIHLRHQMKKINMVIVHQQLVVVTDLEDEEEKEGALCAEVIIQQTHQ